MPELQNSLKTYQFFTNWADDRTDVISGLGFFADIALPGLGVVQGLGRGQISGSFNAARRTTEGWKVSVHFSWVQTPCTPASKKFGLIKVMLPICRAPHGICVWDRDVFAFSYGYCCPDLKRFIIIRCWKRPQCSTSLFLEGNYFFQSRNGRPGIGICFFDRNSETPI